MTYSIDEVSQMLEIPISTLRYYDKKGLLSLVERTNGNIRIFSDMDVRWLNMIECLKSNSSIKMLSGILNNLFVIVNSHTHFTAF